MTGDAAPTIAAMGHAAATYKSRYPTMVNQSMSPGGKWRLDGGSTARSGGWRPMHCEREDR